MVTDNRGVEIKIGQTVAYMTSSYKSAPELRTGEVVALPDRITNSVYLYIRSDKTGKIVSRNKGEVLVLWSVDN